MCVVWVQRVFDNSGISEMFMICGDDVSKNPKVLCLMRNEDEVKRLATCPCLLHVCSVGTRVSTSAEQSTTTLILPTTGAGLQLHSQREGSCCQHYKVRTWIHFKEKRPNHPEKSSSWKSLSPHICMYIQLSITSLAPTHLHSPSAIIARVVQTVAKRRTLIFNRQQNLITFLQTWHLWCWQRRSSDMARRQWNSSDEVNNTVYNTLHAYLDMGASVPAHYTYKRCFEDHVNIYVPTHHDSNGPVSVSGHTWS